MRTALVLAVGAVVAGAAAGCAHRAPPPPPPPATAPAPLAPDPAAHVVSPRRTAGWYDLKTTLPSSRHRSSRRSRRGAPRPALLRLYTRRLAPPDTTAPSRTQLRALIALPGYTRARRGRVMQAAAWWPLPGDTVVVHFRSPRGDGVIELRGAYRSDSLAGAVWYTSTSGSASYQLGTFLAIKRR